VCERLRSIFLARDDRDGSAYFVYTAGLTGQDFAMPQRNSLMRAPATGCLLAALAIVAHAGGGKAVERGMRFDGPGVVDLADRAQTIAAGPAVVIAELAGADAERIFAAPAVGEDPPVLRFSDDMFGCATPSRRCSLAHEASLLQTDARVVKRSAGQLTVSPASGAPLVFVDWKQGATKNADGDEATHWYLGRLAGSDYLRVEVQFGHDAPGNFLINPQNGKAAFVHNGADLVAPSPDGRLLLTWNALNAPLSLRVAALDAAGPRLVLQCAAPERATRLTPLFKGWRDDAGFDLVLEIGEQSKSMARTALHLGNHAGHWQAGSSDVARVNSLGFSCREGTS
jgi:hypothetical protein